MPSKLEREYHVDPEPCEALDDESKSKNPNAGKPKADGARDLLKDPLKDKSRTTTLTHLKRRSRQDGCAIIEGKVRQSLRGLPCGILVHTSETVVRLLWSGVRAAPRGTESAA